MNGIEQRITALPALRERQAGVPTGHCRLCRLLTILLVVAGLGLLTTFLPPRVYPLVGAAPEEHAHNEVMRIKEVVELYVVKTGDRNVTLEKLVQEDAKGWRYLEGTNDQAPKDPWGTPYEIRPGDKPHKWIVLSAGPDKHWNTDDDIRSDRR